MKDESNMFMVIREGEWGGGWGLKCKINSFAYKVYTTRTIFEKCSVIKNDSLWKNLTNRLKFKDCFSYCTNKVYNPLFESA